jgi:hypothetical protein
MGNGLVWIGLTIPDIVERPIDCLPEGEATNFVGGIEIIPIGKAAYPGMERMTPIIALGTEQPSLPACAITLVYAPGERDGEFGIRG